MMRAPPIALLLVATTWLPSVASAGEVTPETRAAVERAFLDGRIAEAATLLGPIVAENGLPPPDPHAPTWTERMLGWRAGPGPGGNGWAERPFGRTHVHRGLKDVAIEETVLHFPVVKALLAEREYRETLGVQGLPDAGPLASLPDPGGLLKWALDRQRYAYRPVKDEDSPDPEVALPARQRAQRARDLMDRAWLWALLSLGALVVSTVLAGVFVRPRSSGS